MSKTGGGLSPEYPPTRMARENRQRISLLAALMLALSLLLGLAVQLQEARQNGLRAVEAMVRDTLKTVLASTKQDARIALVDIDEDTLRTVGAWPWSRSRLADLAERLLDTHRVKRVVFDLVLPASGDAVGDARLAALARQGLLVLAQAFDYADRHNPARAGTPTGALDRPWHGPVAAATGHVANVDSLSDARCVGNVGFRPDFDGRLRRLPLVTQWQGASYPTLAVAALQCSHGPDAALAAARRVPLARDGTWELRFARTDRHYLAVPAAVALDAPAIPELADRITLVASSALGLSDRVTTPLSASAAGVTVHAVALTELLDIVDGATPTPPPPALLPIWLVASTLLVWWAIARWRRLRAIAACSAVALAGWLGLALWTIRAGQPQAVTPALWTYAGLVGLFLPIDWSLSQTRIRARTRLLSRYLAKPVLDELLRADTSDPLQPQLVEISVLIADMEDYTRITARSTLPDAAALTTEFLERLTRPILAHRGTLDSYTGDGVLAFWGAPLNTPAHADLALQAALEILDEVSRFNAERRANGVFPVRVRIGIATGVALVGELGTRFRSSYTAIGDVVNTASRLQQAARNAQYDIVVSSDTAQAVRQHSLVSIGKPNLPGLPSREAFTPIMRPPVPPASQAAAATDPSAATA